ncbi:MAG TPA: sigma factor-like helix-turn-helix DNA-binding protein [Streptosporangiaceae bacterium]
MLQTAGNATLIALYNSDYTSLVRLAALLVRDVASAELIVQEAFTALCRSDQNRDAESVRRFLHQLIVRRSRSVVRRRAGAHRHTGTPSPSDARRACAPDQLAIISALWRLKARQREVVILRHYADLSDRQIAAATQLSRGSVRRSLRRGVAALGLVLAAEPESSGSDGTAGSSLSP